MQHSNVEYLIDSLIIENFAKDSSLHKFAQSSIMSSLAQGIKDYVFSMFDKEHPISSIMTFIGPGLLWKLGFPTLGIFYEVASALGFDWKGFWQAVGENIKDFLTAIVSSGQKPSESDFSNKIDNIVESAGQQYFRDNPNERALDEVRNKFSFKQELNNIIELKAIANIYKTNKKIIKNSSAITAKLSRFFIRAIKWVIKTALISLGFAAAGGAASTLLGTKPFQTSQTDETAETYSPTAPTISIPMSENVSPDLTAWHKNDLKSAWLERGDIAQIQNILLSWILNAYPQLEHNAQDIVKSNSFSSMINRFQSRNSMAEGLGIYSIPHPFQRKIDIVNQIVGPFLQNNQINQNNQQFAKQDNISYK